MPGLKSPAKIDELFDLAKEWLGPKVAVKALRSGMSGISAVLARETRRVLRSHGLSRANSLLYRSITTQTTTDRKTGTITARAGARNQKVEGKNPAKYFHLYDGGTKPHFQPNAFRPYKGARGVNGRVILIRVPGGAMHRGAKAHPTRERAQRQAEPEILRRFERGFDRTLVRELNRIQRGQR